MSEILNLIFGYKAIVETDDDCRNPWKDVGDCGIPILVFNLDHSHLENYGTGLDIQSVASAIKPRLFGPKNRTRLLEAIGIDAEDCHCYLGNLRTAKADDWKNAILEVIARDRPYPRGWTSASTFFEGLEFLCNLARIPCKWEKSTGYSQGDAAWVFVAAMPDWQKKVGWTAETPQDKDASLQADLDLWSAWAWGDVYGYSEIQRPDGSPVHSEHDSCWGFYGDDHEKSGLKENAESVVASDLAWLARESIAAHDAACRGVITAA